MMTPNPMATRLEENVGRGIFGNDMRNDGNLYLGNRNGGIETFGMRNDMRRDCVEIFLFRGMVCCIDFCDCVEARTVAAKSTVRR